MLSYKEIIIKITFLLNNILKILFFLSLVKYMNSIENTTNSLN